MDAQLTRALTVQPDNDSPGRFSALTCVLPKPAQAAQGASQNEPIRITAPPIVVTAQKEPADSGKLPVSVTAVSRPDARRGRRRRCSEAAGDPLAEHLLRQKFSARKLGNARMRGIVEAHLIPRVTHLHRRRGAAQRQHLEHRVSRRSGQVEFVRGPQGALCGRNTLGGLISIASAASVDGHAGPASVRVPIRFTRRVTA